ncbi:putative trna-splicing endonuclease subunit protein [Botrytis fragariae]|uniref:tRNA-intron lyase n=1 Tax=Botrytis fragariae TaxID=1964551 RepID=A0A8H6AY16_9HELO|nr:putative trna-splicing endonuclease subunit protein [Botrytis fragariae]KAF5875859.1 putative trna-splicing endonuclease subunit protein [Botrytis fragariae]
MADTNVVTPAGAPIEATTPTKPKHVGPRPPSKFQQLNKLYGLPAPIRTFPLPTLIPHNPLSLFHILYVWLSQTINRPSSHFDTLYQGWFSPETRSIHITDSRCIRGLWEQGFYGKGSLSRSEPSWLTREKKRRGVSKAIASEDVTRKRRADRQQTKWERARKEREAIDQTLLAEAQAKELSKTNVVVSSKENMVVEVDNLPASAEPNQKAAIDKNSFSHCLDSTDDVAFTSITLSEAPTGPMQLLALPNSFNEVVKPQAIKEPLSRSAVDADKVVSSNFASFNAPTGPLGILALPNSLVELNLLRHQDSINSFSPTITTIVKKSVSKSNVPSAPVGPQELLALPNSATDASATFDDLNPDIEDESLKEHLGRSTSVEVDNSITTQEKFTPLDSSTPIAPSVDVNIIDAPLTPVSTVSVQNSASDGDVPENGSSTSVSDRQKSVRFSPTVEQTTFLPSQPPSPERAVISTEEKPEAISELVLDEDMVIEDQEHFQLTMEEAFFLSYGLGALTVLDPITKLALSNQDLFSLCRKSSYFPPTSNPSLSTDDPFLVNYVVYHHFRSLGWVVRGGTKFSVDYLLYNRGPVFSHAEFAVLILPSYSDPYWSSGPFLQNYVKGKQERSWSWMHCINRVITQVKKTLILVYVDIPAPVDGNMKENSVDELLGKYKVREVVLKRWSPNRSRD